MKLLKYVILMLLLWNVSSFSLMVFGETAGKYSVLLTYVLLLAYYFFSKKNRPLFLFLILGFLYYLISGLIYMKDYELFVNELIKYAILIICGAELARNTTRTQLCIVLLLGSLSIVAHSLFFADDFGRYSGYYLDPNGAGFVCLIGYCLTFDMSYKKLKLPFLFLFTFAGVLTFSRFFLGMWVIVNILAVFSNRKNAQGMFIGLGALVLLVSVSAILRVNTERFAFIESLFDNKVETGVITEDSRTEQWSSYSDDIMDNPIFGNGFKTLSGSEAKQGVHNTYLMVIGEAGFMPFLVMILIYLLMFNRSLGHFKEDVHRPLIALSLMGILMVVHNYFNNEFIVFASVWLYVKVQEKRIQEETPEEVLITNETLSKI